MLPSVDDEDSATLQDHFAPPPPPIAVLSVHVPCGRPIDSFRPPPCIMHKNRCIGARVTINVVVWDLDLPVPEAADNRRLEVVADGLPIFGGSQLRLVCALHCDGSPHTGAVDTDGVVLQRTRKRKERRCPRAGGERKLGAPRCLGHRGRREVVT